MLADTESFKRWPTTPQFIPGRWLYMDSAGGDMVLGTNSIGGACLAVHGSAQHYWRRRIFRPAGIASGSRGARTSVSLGTLYWGWFDATNAVIQMSVEFDGTNGQIRAYRGCRWSGGGATLLASSALMSFVPGAEFYAEATVTIDPAAGYIQVYVNEQPVFSSPVTAANTQISALSLFHTTQDMSSPGALGGVQIAQSDMYWTDTTNVSGAGNVGRLGTVEIASMTASGPGSTVQFAPSGGTNAGNLSGTPAGDGASNGSQTVGAIDLLQMGPSVTGLSCAGVQIERISRADSAGIRQGQTLFKSAGTTATGVETIENTSYTSYFDVFEVDPSTSEPMTIAALNAAQAGYKVAA